jgi:hypothetical protein
MEALQNLIHYVPKQAAASSSVPAVFAAETTKKHPMTTWNASLHHFDWKNRKKMASCFGVAVVAAAAEEALVPPVEQRPVALRASHSSLDLLTHLVL